MNERPRGKNDRGATGDGEKKARGDSRVGKILVLPKSQRVAKEAVGKLAQTTVRDREEKTRAKIAKRNSGDYFFTQADRESFRIRAEKILQGAVAAVRGNSQMSGLEFLREVVLCIADLSVKLEIPSMSIDSVLEEAKKQRIKNNGLI